MLCWQKEGRSCSRETLMHCVTAPLLSHCIRPSELSPVHRHYPVEQQHQSMSDMTLEERRSDEYQEPLSLQQINTKINKPVVDDSTGLHTLHSIVNCRKKTIAMPSQQKDAAYYEKRRKNNESAKKSREARQHKERVIVAHVQILKEENMRLKAEHKLLSRQNGELLTRLYNRSSVQKN